jgi:hypothetical protein
MAMTRCKECGTEISTKAEACPKCGAKVARTSMAALGGLAIIAFIVISVAIGVSDGGGSSPSGTSSAMSTAQAGGTEATAGAAAAAPSASGPDGNLTAAQRNAVRSAKSYLDMSGFSRQGLIDQLSSDYGEKFSVADATAAVDNLNVDWNVRQRGLPQRIWR